MKLQIVAQGRLREAAWRTLADDYKQRLTHYIRTEEIELKNQEGWQRALSPDALVIALEVGGKSYSSRAFAQQLQSWFERGKSTIVFAIGGADGLPDSVLAAANAKLSLSPMTLPHRMARLLLLEQLYRAFSILRGEPYARED